MESYVFFVFPVVISEMIPFNVPIQNQNRVGGVKTPPYAKHLVFVIICYYSGWEKHAQKTGAASCGSCFVLFFAGNHMGALEFHVEG